MVLVSCLVGAGCSAVSDSVQSRDASLRARPAAKTTTVAAGTDVLGLGGARDGVVYPAHRPTTARARLRDEIP